MNSAIINILWLVLIISSLIWPLMHQKRVDMERVDMIKRLERKRRSRVITIIHRQEAISFLGIPIARYISIEDSEQILRAIRFTPDDMPIDIVLHTPGGLVLAAEQIALAIKKHPGKVTIFVPHYAMSGGTMLALAADEIIMDENAVLGPVDPQIGSYPASSILNVLKMKPLKEVDDNTLILADIAEKATAQVKDTVRHILQDRLAQDETRQIADLLTKGYWTHDYPLIYDHLVKMGLPVRTGLPKEVYVLMELYPQPRQRRPAVQYIPVPYRDQEGPRRA
jgi:ClpP class serine protease